MISHAPILAILLPLFAAFLMPVIGILSRRRGIKRAREWFAIAVVLAEFAVVASMLPAVWGGQVLVYQLGGWQPPWGVNLAIDGLNLLVALIVAGIGTLVMIYSFVYMERDTGLDQYYTLFLLIVAGMMGVALTGDIFNLYVFFEIMCISSYALVAFRRKWQSIEASIKYMIVSSLGTSFILLGIALLYGLAGSLNIADLAQKLGQVAPSAVIVPLALFVTGLGIKIAVVPLHMWMPDAYQAAPSAVAALFSGATATVGIYAMVRVVYTLFGAFAIGIMLAALGLVTMVIGALMALAQRDLKRLLAYSGISQVGYVLLGIGLGTVLGIQGGLFHLFNNAIYKTMLFMIAGAIIYRVGTSNMDQLGGLWKNMPVTATLFAVGALAISGVPPFNGFASKWMIYVAGIEAGQPVFTIIALITSALTLAYFLKALNSIFLGQRPKHLSDVKETPLPMMFPIMLLAVLCVVFGVLPQLGIDIVRPAQEAVMNSGGYISAVLGGA
ncbi:MAG: NADH-quinone oxidoreductase subunit M [Hadesarchaea archaeon]|nr:MAG: NADH-quinone oxidoreductase subunit M [Hadesarchaea archaeon]